MALNRARAEELVKIYTENAIKADPAAKEEAFQKAQEEAARSQCLGRSGSFALALDCTGTARLTNKCIGRHTSPGLQRRRLAGEAPVEFAPADMQICEPGPVGAGDVGVRPASEAGGDELDVRVDVDNEVVERHAGVGGRREEGEEWKARRERVENEDQGGGGSIL
ncbi:hypothetical protein B0T10DRAFT_467083 [Thelonectria olida]|uniref:Uncharacterized protein n=1 Tax=Thelonectria olida TaxID=1576542 RepID=A0A9P9AJY5_9HYPO|nr:hypothetical protein B0T10DRAFT_467083 [Thelonectria olida]